LAVKPAGGEVLSADMFQQTTVASVRMPHVNPLPPDEISTKVPLGVNGAALPTGAQHRSVPSARMAQALLAEFTST
jgi:hypothetical protein